MRIPRRSQSRLGGESQRLGLAALAVALCFLFQWEAGGFITTGNFKSILLNATPVMIVAITMGALVVSGNVDLSVGGMYALCTVVTALIARETQDLALAIAAGLALGFILGLGNGLLVHVLNISPLIVTLALAFVYRGISYVITDGGTIFGLPKSFSSFGRSEVLGLALPVWIGLIVFAIGAFLLTRTVGGMRTYAIGGNPEAARLNGVDVTRHVVTLFTLNGLAVGVVGVLTASQLASGSGNIGLKFEFDVLTAVILGGVAFVGGSGLPVGIFLGVLTIAILNAGMVFAGLNAFYQEIAKGGILLLALGADQLAGHYRARRSLDAVDDGTVERSKDQQELGTLREAELQSTKGKEGDVVFRCANIAKRYGAVEAVRDVGFEVRKNEIVCLLGDNGAGKSTVIKAITGVVQADAGGVELHDEAVKIPNPAAARQAGIETVYQDLALCPNLGAAHNLALGAEPTMGSLGVLSPLNSKRMEALAKDRLGRLGITLENYFRPVSSLSGGQRQSVAIARVAHEDVAVAILDEPTAALGVTQSRRTLRLIRTLADRDVGVILITHDVETVTAIADRIVVLRLGSVLYDGPVEGTSESELIHLMAGVRPTSLSAPGR